MTVSFVAAFDEKFGLGKNNTLPWNMPNDMKRFRNLTLNHSVIMGRATFDSMGRPLPKRKNIILSRNKQTPTEGCHLTHSAEEALGLCSSEEEVFIIGGGQIFKLFENLVNKMYLTTIHHDFNCDVFFPEFDANKWEMAEKERLEKDEKNPYACTFYTYVRKA